MKGVRPSRSIRIQLTVQILAGSLIMLFSAGSVFLGTIHRRLVKDFDRLLDAEAEMLVRNAERKGSFILWDLPDAYSAGSRQDPDYCQLFLTDGTVAGISQTLGTDNLPRLEDRKDAVWNAVLPNGQQGRLVQKTFLPRADAPATEVVPDDPHEEAFKIPETMDPAAVEVVVVVARSRESLDELLKLLYLAGAGIAVLMACGLTWIVRRAITRALRPVEEINSQISLISPDTLNDRLHISAPPEELAAIESTVNSLLDRVEQALERERRFSNNIAHELRTPIAELRTACEVGGRWPDDPESTRQFFHDTWEISLHLERIVSALLTLSRGEAGNDARQIRRIELGPFVRNCWLRAAVPGTAPPFSEHLTPDLVVECDEDILGIILGNLMENAISHGIPGALVECAGITSTGGVELRLSNTVKDLQQADLAHIFERFWCKEESRTERRHIGLGLSIVKTLCEMLGLRLRVDLVDNRIFQVGILFPAPHLVEKSLTR